MAINERPAHARIIRLIATIICCSSIAVLTGCASFGARVVSPRVHAFYYPWYANPETDGQWRHWDHAVLPESNPPRRHQPPEDIGACFYPAMGLYSSNNPADVAAHMQQCRQAGVGVLIVSWWGQGTDTDKALPLIFKTAAEHGLKIGFHIEPYAGRGGASLRDDLIYIHDTYGEAPAFYRDPDRADRGIFYVYDSYLTPPEEWAAVLTPDGADTIRNTKYDALVIGLWVKENDGPALQSAGFDGFYTYFAADGFTYGSSLINWPALANWAREHDMLFIPSVGPGYDDARIRPWNADTRRNREEGGYYDRMWRRAIAIDPDIISITSFDEWHEGTQIAPATPKRIPGYEYNNYLHREPEYYLDRTAYWTRIFAKNRKLPPLNDTTPRKYLCKRTDKPIIIDGRLDDDAWNAAPWTDYFVDIEGDVKPRPRCATRAKMLWDDDYFYIAALLDEPHVWGLLERHDEIVFYDNDFEIFIDPDGDTREYYEIEINALNAIFDLFLERTYIDGGPAHHEWNCEGMKTAVHVIGTLNDPSDVDVGWSVEFALPWSTLAEYANKPAPPQDGDVWRAGFSRVEWLHRIVDGRYEKIPDTPENNWVWSPQGTINMHIPELWGYVEFTTDTD